jgi:hypothetical protein
MMEQVSESPRQATIYQLSSYNWVLTVGRSTEALTECIASNATAIAWRANVVAESAGSREADRRCRITLYSCHWPALGLLNLKGTSDCWLLDWVPRNH